MYDSYANCVYYPAVNFRFSGFLMVTDPLVDRTMMSFLPISVPEM